MYCTTLSTYYCPDMSKFASPHPRFFHDLAVVGSFLSTWGSVERGEGVATVDRDENCSP